MSDYDGTFVLDKTKYSLCRYDSAYCSPAEMQAYWIFDDMEGRGNMRSVPSSGTVAAFNAPESVRDRTVAMLSLYPTEASWFAHYGLPLSSFNGGVATFRVDWNGGTNAPKSDFSSGGRFYGWKWSSKETGGSNLSDAAFDFGNPLPSVKWKGALENGAFTTSGYDWTVGGA